MLTMLTMMKRIDTLLDYESRKCNCASPMGERKAESDTDARELHRLIKGWRQLVLLEAGLGALREVFPQIKRVTTRYGSDAPRAFTVTLNR
jgi:hypothetical protein